MHFESIEAIFVFANWVTFTVSRLFVGEEGRENESLPINTVGAVSVTARGSEIKSAIRDPKGIRGKRGEAGRGETEKKRRMKTI